MGDYWTVSSGVANHSGSTCRECRKPIYVNAPIIVRDGRKIRLFYHESCFSGDSDPRTQAQSSVTKWKEGIISPQAPSSKGYGKWSTSSYGFQGSIRDRRSFSKFPARPRRASNPSIAENSTNIGQGLRRSPTTVQKIAPTGRTALETPNSLGGSSTHDQGSSSLSISNATSATNGFRPSEVKLLDPQSRAVLHTQTPLVRRSSS